MINTDLNPAFFAAQIKETNVKRKELKKQKIGYKSAIKIQHSH